MSRDTKANSEIALNYVFYILGVGFIICWSAFVCSIFSREKAEIFYDFAKSFAWQFGITTVVFLTLFFTLKGLLWEKLDDVLLSLKTWAFYKNFNRFRKFLRKFHKKFSYVKQIIKTFIESHEKLAFNLILATAIILVQLFWQWRFGRPVEIYQWGNEVIFGVMGNFLYDVIKSLRKGNFKQPDVSHPDDEISPKPTVPPKRPQSGLRVYGPSRQTMKPKSKPQPTAAQLRHRQLHLQRQKRQIHTKR